MLQIELKKKLYLLLYFIPILNQIKDININQFVLYWP